jgi:hypothetical protein
LLRAARRLSLLLLLLLNDASSKADGLISRAGTSHHGSPRLLLLLHLNVVPRLRRTIGMLRRLRNVNGLTLVRLHHTHGLLRMLHHLGMLHLHMRHGHGDTSLLLQHNRAVLLLQEIELSSHNVVVTFELSLVTGQRLDLYLKRRNQILAALTGLSVISK